MASSQLSPLAGDPYCDNARRRTCKACDRCRLKKTKCDGRSPCYRCRADNTICVFGERKKSFGKVYPKGYVEKLEQQQVWLVHALQELYRLNTQGESWPGDPVKPEHNGRPLVHDLLARLGALDPSKGERFEERPFLVQQMLYNRTTSCQEPNKDPIDSPDKLSALSHLSPSTFSSSQSTPLTQTPSCIPGVCVVPMLPYQLRTTQVNSTSLSTVPTPNSQYGLIPQGVVNPFVLENAPHPQLQYLGNETGFNSFNEVDFIEFIDYATLNLEDASPRPLSHSLLEAIEWNAVG